MVHRLVEQSAQCTIRESPIVGAPISLIPGAHAHAGGITPAVTGYRRRTHQCAGGSAVIASAPGMVRWWYFSRFQKTVKI
jgi:hypothetical protein